MARKTKEKTVRLWIARDKYSQELWLYKYKPVKRENNYYPDLSEEYQTVYDCLQMESTMFPDVTFDNSPQEVEIKLV
jgi:hypothetical protein